jgi:hypothetical protein
MNSRLLLNAGLLVSVIVLTTFAFLHEETPATVRYPLSVIKPQQASQINITVKDQTIEIKKEAGQWTIKQPLQVEADEFRLQAILKLLTVSTEQQYDASGLDLKQYALQPPLATLSIDQQTFLFGNVSAVDNKRYLLTNNKLMLVDDTYFSLLSAGYKNLMRRQLLPSSASIQQITFDQFKIYMNEQAAWEVSHKDVADKTLSADAAKLFVDNWQHIQAYAVYSAHKPYKGTHFSIKTSNHVYPLILQNTGQNTVIINPELNLAYQFDITAHTALLQPDYYRNEAQD